MNNFLKTLLGLLLFIVAGAIALTLLRNANREPSILLSDSACDPPCWSGIRPGETGSVQVYEILGQLNSINKESIAPEYDKDDNLIRIYWYFERPVEDGAGSVNIKDDLVTALNVLTVDSLTVKDLFGRLGEPKEYWAELARGEDREYLDVTLLYPAQGYVAEVILDIKYGASQVEISEGTPVFRVTYFAPAMYEELLKGRILIDKAAIARTGRLAPWSGFGAIAVDRDS